VMMKSNDNKVAPARYVSDRERRANKAIGKSGDDDDDDDDDDDVIKV